MQEVNQKAPVFHNGPGGHYANLMMKLMAAVRLRQLCPGIRLSNFVMPYWNIAHPPIPFEPGERLVVADAEQHVPILQIAHLFATGLVDRVEWRGYGGRMENFPALDECRATFVNDHIAHIGLADDQILCPIRSGEIANGEHGGYVQLPLSFYADLFARLRLRPVFMGQLDATPYCHALRHRFPEATFLPPLGPVRDFQTIRAARHIVVSVSTFVWLAAWLSHARRIVLPVVGLYHPEQFPQSDLLPLGDPRYEFWHFPPHWAVHSEAVLAAHATIERQWVPADPARYARL